MLLDGGIPSKAVLNTGHPGKNTRVLSLPTPWEHDRNSVGYHSSFCAHTRTIPTSLEQFLGFRGSGWALLDIFLVH